MRLFYVSHGLRPKRSSHDAIHARDRIVHQDEVSWMLEIRVADGSLQRLIGKGLHVSVLDGVELSTPESGTAQASVLSSWLQTD